MTTPPPALTLPSPAELEQIAEDTAYGKVTASWPKTLMLALTGGAFIALGFVFFTTSQVGAKDMPYGAARVLGGLVFATGLQMCVLTGAELFTSSTLSLTARASGRITWAQLLRNWGIVYLGNLLGALTIVGLVWYGETWHTAKGAWGKVVLDTAASKVSHGFVASVALGILCNLMVCIAVWMAYSGRTTADKVLAVFPPIALFVASGWEHSVANMFMLPLGVLIKDHAPASYWAESGIDPNAYAGLDWGSVLLHNLLPVTIGNIIGGGIMIGAFYWVVYHRAATYHAHTEH